MENVQLEQAIIFVEQIIYLVIVLKLFGIILICSYNNPTIYSVKEFATSSNNYEDYRMAGSDCNEKTNKMTNDIFIVDQLQKFKLNDDIYCKVYISSDSIENNNNKNSSTINVETILIELFLTQYH